MCINQNNRRMKTILLVVGRTVEQHYITAINDYICLLYTSDAADE